MTRAGHGRAPVVIGIGEVADRSDPGPSTSALVMQAIGRAMADTGGLTLADVDHLFAVDSLARKDRSRPFDACLRKMAGLTPRQSESSASPSGNYPVRFLNDAATTIREGRAEVCLIAGGEAMRAFQRRSGPGSGTLSGTEAIRRYRAPGATDLPARYGLLTPVDVYPLYEQATRHAWGLSRDQATRESAAIWAGNATVASANPQAWIRTAPTASGIAAVSTSNPMIAWPYPRMMVANSGVNMAAALVVTSLDRARSLGLSDDRIVHIGHGAAANEPDGHLDRANFHRLPAMETVLEAVFAMNGRRTGDVDHVELYSCFPCIPKMARRLIEWPVDRPLSIYGGLTFGGGPIGNPMTHALAALVRRIRNGSRSGMVLANGGFATRYHAIVLTRDPGPDATRALPHDMQHHADARRGAVPPLVGDHVGPARLETYSVAFRAGRPLNATLVLRTPGGTRTLARAETADLHRLIGYDDPVGLVGRVSPGPDGLSQWTFD